MKKELYTNAELNVIRFDTEDVITTSGGLQPGENPDTGEGGVVPFV